MFEQAQRIDGNKQRLLGASILLFPTLAPLSGTVESDVPARTDGSGQEPPQKLGERARDQEFGVLVCMVAWG